MWIQGSDAGSPLLLGFVIVHGQGLTSHKAKTTSRPATIFSFNTIQRLIKTEGNEGTLSKTVSKRALEVARGK